MSLNNHTMQSRSVPLPRAKSSEVVGISSFAVQQMIEEYEKENMGLHSIMVIRHGTVAAEAYAPPLMKEDPHMVFSISKSFLSVAYGFALAEGLFTPQTRFLDIFPEYRPKRKDTYLEKLTLQDLIAMRSGKRFTFLSEDTDDWIADFVSGAWEFEPGTSWRYVSENYYILSAAICKKSGMSLSEYLTPRLYIPLGMNVPFWETCPKGIEGGGWGLQLTTEDIGKFILCCHNKGFFNGSQVIPATWIDEATSFQSDTSTVERKADSKSGYGYGFWRCNGHPNTFRCEGLYSQYAISFQDEDACIVMTSAAVDLQKSLDILWKWADYIFLSENALYHSTTVAFALPKPQTSKRCYETEKRINDKTYAIRRNLFLNAIGLPISFLPMQSSYFLNTPVGNIQNLSFHFSEQNLFLSWEEGNIHRNRIPVGFDKDEIGQLHYGDLRCKTLSYATWISEDSLEVTVRCTCAVATRRFVFRFHKNHIIMIPDAIPSISNNAASIGEKAKCIFKGPFFNFWIDVLVPCVAVLLQPKHRGKATHK